MLGSAGLWRAVLHRARADWPVVLAAWVLLTCATTLLASGFLYGDTVALGGVRRAVLAAPAADRGILVRMSVPPADLDATDTVVRAAMNRALEAPGGSVGQVVASGSLEIGQASGGDASEGTFLSSYEGIEAHATLVGGRWPGSGGMPIEAALSEGAAAELGLEAGELVRLADRLDPTATVEVVVVGTWRPDRDDPYWRGSPLELDGVESRGTLTTRGPFVIARDDLLARAGTSATDVQWRGVVDVAGLRIGELEAFRRDVETLRDRLGAALPSRRTFAVESRLAEILTDVDRLVLASRSSIIVLTAQFGVLAGYAVLLVAGLLVERRRAETALLRSRGASSTHLAGLAVGEAILITLPAVAVAPFLGLGVVALLGAVGPLAGTGILASPELSLSAVAVAVVAGAGCVVGLVLPTLASAVSPGRVRAAIGRQGGMTLPQRLGIDLVLVAVAAIALWQLRLYGAPLTRDARGALGLDPLLVAAPALGLLGGAVLAIRIVPRIAEIGERLLERPRGLVAPLGARQLARRPLRYTRSALLLTLAAALGTFAAAHSATWFRSQGDQAAYQAAADARIVVAEYAELPAWAIGPAYRSVAGVADAMPVMRESFSVGRAIRQGPLLALDPGEAARIVDLRSDEAGGPVPALVAQLDDARPQIGAIDVPGVPRRVSLTVDAALGPLPEFGGVFPPEWAGIGGTVVLEDGDGGIHRFTGRPARFVGTGQRIEIPLTDPDLDPTISIGPPVRILAVELSVTSPYGQPAVGTIDLRELAASYSTSGDGWMPLQLDPGARGWSWLSLSVGFGAGGEPSRPYAPPPGAPGRIESTPDNELGPIFATSEGIPTFRLWAPADSPEPLPAIAAERFLAETGTRVGDTIEVATFDLRVPIRIVGSAATYPPLDPATPFVIVDSRSLELRRFSRTGRSVEAEEWWISIEDGALPAVVETLQAARYSAGRIVAREVLAESLTTDPLPLGVIGAFGLGSLAALAFAAVGFIVSATVSTTERLSEFALLRALGLSGRQLSIWLSIENVFLLVVGLLAGSGLGLLLAWLVLPFSTLTSSGTAAVPTPIVVVPAESLVPIYVLAVGMLVAALLVIGRQLPRIRIAGLLRARDE